MSANNTNSAVIDAETHQPRKTRTRSGCLVCRRRRRKCDEQRPICTYCHERGLACEWGMRITFRADNATELDHEHPSMKAASRKRARHFQIVDVTPQVEKDFGPSTGSSAILPTGYVRSPQFDQIVSPVDNISQLDTLDQQHTLHLASASPILETPSSTAVSYSDDVSFVGEEHYIHIPMSPEATSLAYDGGILEGHKIFERDEHHSRSIAPHPFTNARGQIGSRINTEDAADLLALRYMPPQRHPRPDIDVQLSIPSVKRAISQSLDHEPPFFGVDLNNHDGIFLPGSTYQEFHSTLRDHLIYTARSNAPSRHGTPDLPEIGSRVDELGNKGDSDLESSTSGRIAEITPRREFILWKTWMDEIAPWLDKFDNKRHFEHMIPIIARHTPHLKYSILALSARQTEMKNKSKSLSESLALYQQAIHLLLPELESKCTEVISSCVILCVLEMMSCSPKEWRRHLEGCANLLEAVGINGFAGGVEEALFWCFARMDLCGALISQDTTLIPVERWASDVALFKSSAATFDTYANYAVFLCAQCVTYLKDCLQMSREANLSRWVQLVDSLDDWYTQRTEEMKPIMTIPIAQGDGNSPFPTVLYGNGPAVSGNQLYHTAMLLMLQAKSSSPQLQRKQKSIFWHARQICAISESNTHHGAWTNSIQPIWIAGKVMSHPAEHQAILDILEKIETETGWATGWRRDDLRAWWGDEDEES